jgi:hypothetical protein
MERGDHAHDHGGSHALRHLSRRIIGDGCRARADGIAKRLEAGDASVTADIRAALEEMDPKNNTGVNGRAMSRYLSRRPSPR